MHNIPTAWYSDMTDDAKEHFMSEVDDKWKERGADIDDQLYQTIEHMEPEEFLKLRKQIKKDWGVTWGIYA